MRAFDDLPDSLARLVALGQSPDVNIRPVLLRVVVDLFTSKPHQAPVDVQQFEAIVAHLLDDADVEATILVADKLARHPSTPHGLIERLIAEPPAIASRIYAHAPLDQHSLVSAARWSAAEVAAAIASRADLAASTIVALAERPEPEVLRALAANPGLVLDRPTFQHLVRRAREDHVLAARLIDRQADPIDLAPLFPLLRSDQRLQIIEAARRLELGKRQWGRLDGATAEALSHLDRLVLHGERDSFDAALGAALGIDGTAMAALLADDGGEILALALAAAGASPDMAARVFILGDPRIGRSIVRVRALTAIVETVSQHAARRLMNAMTTSSAETHRRPQTPGKLVPPPRRGESGVADAPTVRREVPVLPARRAS